jgi:hypothetical protein
MLKSFLGALLNGRRLPVIDVDEWDNNRDKNEILPYFHPSSGKLFIDPNQRGDEQIVLSHLRAPAKGKSDFLRRLFSYVVGSCTSLNWEDNASVILKYLQLMSIDYVQTERLWNGHRLLFLCFNDELGPMSFECALGTIMDHDERFFVPKDKIWGGGPYSGLWLEYIGPDENWAAPSVFEGLTVREISALHLDVRASQKVDTLS